MSTLNVASHSRAWLGIALALVAAAGYALANTSASVAAHGGSNALTLAAFRFLMPTALLIVWVRVAAISFALPRREIVTAVVLGAVTGLYNWALLRSFSEIPLGLAVLIFYLFPLLAAVIVACLGWERIGWRTAVAIVLALAGLALALDIRGSNLNVKGVTLAFLAALGLAMVIAISGRMLRATDARPLTLYMAATAGALLLALSALTGDFQLPQTNLGWTGFAMAAVLYGFAMILFFIALSMIGTVRVSVFSYADPVISAALGVVVLGEVLRPVQLLGIAIVILALVGATVRQPKAA